MSSEESRVIRARKHVVRNKKKYTIAFGVPVASIIVYLQLWAAICPVLPWNLNCSGVRKAVDELARFEDGSMQLAPDEPCDAGVP